MFVDTSKIVLVLSDFGYSPASTISLVMIRKSDGALLANNDDNGYSPPHFAISGFDSLHLGYLSSQISFFYTDMNDYFYVTRYDIGGTSLTKDVQIKYNI